MIAKKLKSRKNWLLPLERRLGDQASLNQLLVKFLVSFMLTEDINSRGGKAVFRKVDVHVTLCTLICDPHQSNHKDSNTE